MYVCMKFVHMYMKSGGLDKSQYSTCWQQQNLHVLFILLGQ